MQNQREKSHACVEAIFHLKEREKKKEKRPMGQCLMIAVLSMR